MPALIFFTAAVAMLDVQLVESKFWKVIQVRWVNSNEIVWQLRQNSRRMFDYRVRSMCSQI